MGYMLVAVTGVQATGNDSLGGCGLASGPDGDRGPGLCGELRDGNTETLPTHGSLAGGGDGGSGGVGGRGGGGAARLTSRDDPCGP